MELSTGLWHRMAQRLYVPSTVNLLDVPRYRLGTLDWRAAFIVAGPSVWNSLPDYHWLSNSSINSFKRLVFVCLHGTRTFNAFGVYCDLWRRAVQVYIYITCFVHDWNSQLGCLGIADFFAVRHVTTLHQQPSSTDCCFFYFFLRRFSSFSFLRFRAGLKLMFANSSRSGVGLQVSWLRVLRLNVGLRGFETAHKVALHSTVFEAKLDAIITLWSHSQKQKHCE